MTELLVSGMCGACREQDCECCDAYVLQRSCGCGCALLNMLPVLVVRNRYPVPALPTPRSNRTHCPQGHPLIGDNVYTEPGRNRRGRRLCRTCRRASWRHAKSRHRKENP